MTNIPDYNTTLQSQIAKLQDRIDRLERENNTLIRILYKYFYKSGMIDLALEIRDC